MSLSEILFCVAVVLLAVFIGFKGLLDAKQDKACKAEYDAGNKLSYYCAKRMKK